MTSSPLNPALATINSDTTRGALIALTVVVMCVLVVATVGLAAMWRVYAKAAAPGWAALVPIYNVIVLLRIGLRSPYWTLLLAVPTLATVVELGDPLMPLRDPGLYGLLTLAALAAGLALSVVCGTGSRSRPASHCPWSAAPGSRSRSNAAACSGCSRWA